VYVVRDLSRTGVLLEGGPDVAPGSRVRIHLKLSGQAPLSVQGRVLRLRRGLEATGRVAVAFRALTPEKEDRIGNVLVHELAKLRRPTCMVASASASERTLLTRRLTALGYHVLAARTPAEVIHLMANAETPVKAIVLGDTVGHHAGLDLAAFLGGAYPAVRLVLALPAHHKDPDSHSQHLVHAIVRAPWNGHKLRSSLLATGLRGQRGYDVSVPPS
jgi:hypothetical protein